MTRDELIAALAAEGPSRELDLVIAELAGYRRVHPTERPATWFRPDGTFCGLAPAFTESLDAALLLLPEGWAGRLWFGKKPRLRQPHDESDVVIWSPDNMVRESFFGPRANAATPALALCIAALKADA